MLEWSQNIVLSDGEQINLYDTEKDFGNLIKDRLGYEAYTAYNEILEETRLEAETDLDDDIADDLELYYVSARYRPTGCRKDRGYSGAVIATSKEDAIDKFKEMIPHYSDYSYRYYCTLEDKGGFMIKAF